MELNALDKIHRCQSQINEDHLNKKLLPLLKEIISKEVAMNSATRSNYTDILRSILADFKSKFNHEDNVFPIIFEDYYFTGSYFEGLRVKEATEFDINIVLKFTFQKDDVYMIKEVDNPPSYATFQLKQPLGRLIEVYPQGDRMKYLATFFDEDNYLIGKRVLSYFQSLVDIYVDYENSYGRQGVKKVTKTNSGPARTLQIRTEDSWICVDLVPVISIDGECLKKVTLPADILGRNPLAKCFLVPKPLKNPANYDVTTEDASRLWRIYIPSEKQIISRKRALKPVIKLVKCIRDKEKWNICSYTIKTVAFWLVKKHPDAVYWDERKMGIRFIEVLQALGCHMQSGQLPNIFYPEFNILYDIKKQVLDDNSSRIKKIVQSIIKNPKTAKKLFKIK